jgi:hypothetical protein
MFEKYNKTTAVGPYLSCLFNPHIQSFMLSVDKRGLAVLNNVFRCPGINEKDRFAWIIDTEVRLGKVMLNAGYEIRGFLLNSAGGSKDKIQKSMCPNSNPTKNYPISSVKKARIFRLERFKILNI